MNVPAGRSSLGWSIGFAAADPASHPEHGPAWQTGRLLYTAIPRSRFRALYDQMAAAGMDTSGYERFRDIGTPDDQIQVEQDVAAQAPTKLAALQSHQTQFGPDSFFRQLPDSALQESLSREYFIQGWPAPPPCPRLADLFAGL
jgi:LmbE family N-acetylglucosaminyl deacetylase